MSALKRSRERNLCEEDDGSLTSASKVLEAAATTTVTNSLRF